MNSGMYAALSGSISAQKRLEVLTNNLANANTTGFKADRIEFQSLLAQKTGATPNSETPVFSTETFSTDFTSGTLQHTENLLDVALQGDGFFVVNTPNGPAYTRQGNFHRAASGRIVNADGYEVQGTGNLSVNASRIEITGKGEIMADGVQQGTLTVVDFPKPYQMNKVGNGLFAPANAQAAPTAVTTTEVKQGYLEGSNVQVVREMARMIEASRYFDICTRAVRNYDDISSKAANDLGKI
ncbi:flagellar basal-body rod protein FlgF [Geomesophilobacter sediminis]|uniref:Flagellar basal-body rod protein FlgF n=1 Tax=Geomesophilobacter sediminis TaxID=2798584 RepID=A0A8J7INJ9_9BACT|nr:flagellar basal-body rod protein FlgF [Geomesophilobacter sediminis]MBJ6724818.1 flagellar basal-body rod protein FlgF [Geomesophilobacter sediminis]